MTVTSFLLDVRSLHCGAANMSKLFRTNTLFWLFTDKKSFTSLAHVYPLQTKGLVHQPPTKPIYLQPLG